MDFQFAIRGRNYKYRRHPEPFFIKKNIIRHVHTVHTLPEKQPYSPF
jgi:hypothetical protein